MYLGNVADNFGLINFVVCDWGSFGCRFWAYTDHWNDRKWGKVVREVLLWKAIRPIGNQDGRIVRGWFLISEGFW